MGNSGSMHNIDIEPFTDYSHNFYRNSNNDNEKLSKYHNSIKWTQSYPLEGSTKLLRSSFVSNGSGGSSGDNGSLQSNQQHRNNNLRQQRHHHHHHHHHLPPPPSRLPPPLPQLSHQSHFKVLPDLNEGPPLRNTTNGAIIHSGGTISGRKAIATATTTSSLSSIPPPPPPLLQRSRTSIEYDLNGLRYGSTRNGDGGSSTSGSGSMDASPLNDHHYRHTFSTNPERNFNNLSQQQFNNRDQRSSIDLRNLQQQHSSNEINLENNNNNNNNIQRGQKGISKAEKLKNKKRKAPDPPLKDNNTSSSTLLMRTDTRQSSQNLKMLPKENHERKSRLFKTKAESRKNFTQQDKLTLETSDLHNYNGNLNVPLKGKENLPRETSRNHQSFMTSGGIGENRLGKDQIRQMPPFPFRREKSFDITLLTAHNKQHTHRTYSGDEYDKTSLDRYKQRLQPVGSVNDLTTAQRFENFSRYPVTHYEDKLNKNQNESPSSLSSSTDKKFNDKKLSQPKFLANCDFKRELQEVTKRRSIALEYMEKRREQQQQQQQHQQEGREKENLIENEQQKKILEKRISREENNKLLPNRKNLKVNLESKIPKLIKTFYFGMDSKDDDDDDDDDDVDDGNVGDIIEQQSQIIDGNKLKLPRKSESSGSILSSDHNEHNNNLINNVGHHVNHLDEDDNDDEDDDDDDDDDIYDDDDDNYHIGNEEIIKNESDDLNSDNIQIHVRPTLPRRQLEVPQFSPAAAWRMLNEQHKNDINRNSINNKQIKLQDTLQQQQQPIEEKIHKIYREPIPMYPMDNKSRDSGISGDAGQQERISDSQDNNDIIQIQSNNNIQTKFEPFLIPWTPQQDLDGETSSEGELQTKNENFDKYPNYSHLFSLSLPRESHLSSAPYVSQDHPNDGYEEKQGYSSLLKLKRRLSEALTNMGATPPDRMMNYCNNDNNWLLSRSVTSSIENNHHNNHSLTGGGSGGGGGGGGGGTIDYNCQQEQDNLSSQDDHRSGGSRSGGSGIQPSSLSYLSGGGKHGMYLPQNHNDEYLKNSKNSYENNNNNNSSKKNLNNGNKTSSSSSSGNGKRKDTKQSMVDNWNSSKKYENKNKIERESLQDIVPSDSNENKSSEKSSSNKSRGGHRYTFQSAVRQIERRRIAEKLSKEAEQKEAYRLSELEAMKRVEEDFQRKRAKEKASIRHQWRMFSLDENRCSSLPFDWQINNNNNNNNDNHPQQQLRTEPEGAVSGATTPSLTSIDANDANFYYDENEYNRNLNNNKKYTSTKITATTTMTAGRQDIDNIEGIIPTTKILSEFRTMRREYTDYRTNNNNNNSKKDKDRQPIVCQILSKSYQKSK